MEVSKHLSFELYHDDSGNLYIHDTDIDLTFERERLPSGNYGLVVIIGEENGDYWEYCDQLSPEQPCGFQIYEELSKEQWKELAKTYLEHKNMGEEDFNKWLKENFWNLLKNDLYVDTWYAESMPPPTAPKEDWDDFSRSFEIEKHRLKYNYPK